MSDIFQLIENKNEKKVSVYDARVNNQIIIDDQDLDLDTYLYISPNKFGIYLFDKKSSKSI